MDHPKKQTPDYGNWVSNRLFYITGGLSLLFTALCVVSPFFLLGTILFMGCLVYFMYARQKFSPQGGNLQARIRDLVLEHLDWDGHGEALDIGCGNAPLTISLAKKYRESKVIGMDYWGSGWDYSQETCEANTVIEGVSKQIRFEKASASNLPYTDGRFDAVVSNFVFHEVADCKDKRTLVKEALRILKKGGAFAFQDLFLVEKIYGDMDAFLEGIKSWGVRSAAL